MKILIVSGLSSGDVGGPAQYGPKLKNEFQDMGYKVSLISYGFIEKALPPFLRHLLFFLRIIPAALFSQYILALDAMSTGLPAVLAGTLLRKKVVVRVGGDFLWSSYVNRTGEPALLPDFYRIPRALSGKEKAIQVCLRFVLKKAHAIAFNTEWQKNIWESEYRLRKGRVVRNFIPPKSESDVPRSKNFLWAGRVLPEKNLALLKRVAARVGERYPDFSLEIATGEPQHKILARIKSSYAVISSALADVCPNFIIEGISLNKPFVMTKETGLGEIYPQGGIFFDPLDEREIEGAIEAMLDSKIYNDSIEALKKNTIEHSWKKLAEEFIEIWKQN